MLPLNMDLDRWNAMDLLSNPAFGRPFKARRLKRASLAWINFAWFKDKGGALLEQMTEDELERWLLDEFAFAVPSPLDDDKCAYGDEEKVFVADSYGETGKVFHGGSARAGTALGFQIKGIGVTPLLGVDADPLHSHGSAWMEEGIREIIFSEIFERELPWGAVPVVALIDTGVHAVGSRHAFERRALILRPFVFRLSHMQRAPMFRPAEGVRNAQLADAARTKLVIGILANSPRTLGAPTEDGNFSFLGLFKRIAEQIAYCQVNRLTHGGFLGSNIALDGRILDFGAARALPTWNYCALLPGIPGFGRDREIVLEIIKSTFFYFNKYSVERKMDVPSEEIAIEFDRHLARYFRDSLLSLWGPGALHFSQEMQDYLINVAHSLYAAEQKQVTPNNMLNDVDPLWLDHIERTSLAACQNLKLAAGYDKEFDSIDQAARTLLQNCTPRRDVFRENLQERIFSEVCPQVASQKSNMRIISSFIEGIVGASVRPQLVSSK